MQQEFLKIAGKQTHTWVEAAKAGKPYQTEHLAELAREGMENFVKAQKQFMDVIAEETAKATGAKHSNGVKKIKKTELAALARQATESFRVPPAVRAVHRGGPATRASIDDIVAQNLDVLESDTSQEELTARDLDSDDFARCTSTAPTTSAACSPRTSTSAAKPTTR